MSASLPVVISASRRTDIPAFYMEWFMDQINRGFFEAINPYNRKVTRVSAISRHVHTIVFWSKNFEKFVEQGYGQILAKMGYHLFFNFTINSESSLLEPNVPSLTQRLGQLEYLCHHFGADTINLRFDPICFYEDDKGHRKDNLKDFPRIAESAGKYGIKRCITSFMDHYPKIQKRVNKLKDFKFIYPEMDKKRNCLLGIEKITTSLGMGLFTCCEKDLLAMLPKTSKIKNSSCIHNDLLQTLFGGNLLQKKDYGQRSMAGCGCKVSVDIGVYDHHPCYHNCLFCYANPKSDPNIKQRKNHENRFRGA